MWAVFEALEAGWSIEQVHEATRIDPWFLTQFAEIVELRRVRGGGRSARDVGPELLLALKRAGFGDEQLGVMLGMRDPGDFGAALTKSACIRSTSGSIPAPPSSSRSRRTSTARTNVECEADPTDRPKVVILGSGPEPDRPGDRVRLLLLFTPPSRCARRATRR